MGCSADETLQKSLSKKCPQTPDNMSCVICDFRAFLQRLPLKTLSIPHSLCFHACHGSAQNKVYIKPQQSNDAFNSRLTKSSPTLHFFFSCSRSHFTCTCIYVTIGVKIYRNFRYIPTLKCMFLWSSWFNLISYVFSYLFIF